MKLIYLCTYITVSIYLTTVQFRLITVLCLSQKGMVIQIIKNSSVKYLTKLVYKVYTDDGSFFVLVHFFDMNKTEHITFNKT